MQEMDFFRPNEVFDNAIENEEHGVLKALLIGIIGADPTFATTEYEEALEYIKERSEIKNGEAINLSEARSTQGDEYKKGPESWDEEYYRMLLVWYRDNYADERLDYIKEVGKVVYKDKVTWGKSRAEIRETDRNQTSKARKISSRKKKDIMLRAINNDTNKKRVPIITWFQHNWRLISVGFSVISLIVIIIWLLSKKE